jgi:hypothetical protein
LKDCCEVLKLYVGIFDFKDSLEFQALLVVQACLIVTVSIQNFKYDEDVEFLLKLTSGFNELVVEHIAFMKRHEE